jgi:carbon-monoxide dehydrogenase medium subunit
MGTIGGSVANNDPAADYPAALLALGATVVTNKRSHRGRRVLQRPVRDGARRMARSSPRSRSRSRQKAGYAKFRNPASRYASWRRLRRQDAAARSRVAVNGAAPCVFRQGEMEAALGANWSAEAVGGIKQDATDLNGDIHGSAEYRAHLVTVMAKRAVAAAG